MNCGGRSQVRAEIGGRVGASGIALCSRIAVFFEKVLDGENRVRDIRIDDGQPAFGGCQARPSGRGQVGGHEGACAFGGVHRAPPLR